MKRALAVRTLVVVASIAVVATGCSSSSNSKGSSATGSGASSAAAAGPIKIMGIGIMQSADLTFPDEAASMQANVDGINAAGGINGHQVQLEICNDKGDPNTAVGCARQAVSDHVVAVTEPYEPFSSQIVPILDAAKIPLVYGTFVADPDGQSDISFPRDAGILGTYGAIAVELAKEGCKTIGAVVVQNPNNEQGASYIQQAAEASGAKFVQTPTTVDQADYSAPVAKLISEGADCVIPDTNPDGGAKVVQAVAQSGKSIKLGTISAEFGASQLAQLGSAVENMTMVGEEYLATDTDVPAVKAIVDGMAKYEPNVKLEDFVGIAGWAGVSAIQQVIKQVSGSVTGASVKAAAEKATVDTGLYDKVSWSSPGPIAKYPRLANLGYLTWHVQGGKAALQSQSFTPLTVLK